MSPFLSPGLRVAHFRIESLLGKGGMGEVYRAHDTKLDRPVAFKILPPELVSDRSRLERFALEARAASALAHPHIVSIYEIGEERVETGDLAGESLAVHYIAMELIEGATLRELIHEQHTDLRTLLRYLSQAADGVARAHEANVIHRDLKPDNIMVTREGYAKVLDFGLAKLDAELDADDDLTSAPTVRDEPTREGAVVGTVGYMSPEQVRGRPVDHRTDVFAFGCLIYEAATRRRPFFAESRVETLHKILHDQPQAMEELNPEVPGALRRLVKRCLAKEPERRFQSMRDLALALADLAEEFDSLRPASSSQMAPIVAEPGSAGARRRRLWLGALAAVAILVLVAWLLGGRSSRGPSPGDESAPALSSAELAIRELTNTADVSHVAISPDGDYLAQGRWRPNGTGLWITHIATGSSVEVVAPEGDLGLRGVTFTPDGNYLVFVRNDPERPLYSSAYQVPVLGGEPRRLLYDIDTAPSFSPDGQRMAFVRGASHLEKSFLMVANADGTEPTPLAEADLPDWFEIKGPAWSPDGASLVVIRDAREGLANRLVAVDSETGAIRDSPLSRADFSNISSIAWLPDGSALVLTGRPGMGRDQLWLVAADDGSTRRLSNDLSEWDGVSLTADGETIASRHESWSSRLWMAPANRPDDLRSLTASPRDQINMVAISADRTVFFDRLDTSGFHVWRTSRTGDSTVKLTGEDNWFSPEASADGSTLLAIRRAPEDGSRELWRLDPESGQQLERLFDDFTNVWQKAIAPDASWVAATVDDGALWIQHSGDEKPRLVFEPTVGGPWVSPDGSMLAYRRFRTEEDGSGTAYIEIVTPQGEHLGELDGGRITDADGWFVAFSPEGDGITAHQYVGGRTNLWHLPLDGSPWVQLTDFDHGFDAFINDAAWGPDGEWLVLSKGEYWSDAVLVEGFR